MAFWLFNFLQWPFLATQHYDPTSSQLRAYRWNPITDLKDYKPTKNYVYREGFRFYLIPYRELYPWMHDPARGTHSLQQLLPTKNLGVYLRHAVTGADEPFGREDNPWLEDLNAKAADPDGPDGPLGTTSLEHRLAGTQNIYVIYGTGRDTEAGYSVVHRAAGARGDYRLFGKLLRRETCTWAKANFRPDVLDQENS